MCDVTCAQQRVGGGILPLRADAFFFFEGYGDHRDLHVVTHSFPTRRSSDLSASSLNAVASNSPSRIFAASGYRSEEHTSELQSRNDISYAVFCLKKKKTQ